MFQHINLTKYLIDTTLAIFNYNALNIYNAEMTSGIIIKHPRPS